MSAFFDNHERFLALQGVLKSWEGTPFREGVAFKGSGADCVQCIADALFEVGAIDRVTFPPYVTRGGGVHMLEILVGVLDAIPNLTRVWSRGSAEPCAPQRGDVVLFSAEKNLHHLGIMDEPPTLWHMMNKFTQGSLGDPPLSRRLWAVYRVAHE